MRQAQDCSVLVVDNLVDGLWKRLWISGNVGTKSTRNRETLSLLFSYDSINCRILVYIRVPYINVIVV